MKTRFYLNGKKITKKAAEKIAGKERLEQMIEESIEVWYEEPGEENSYMVSEGMLDIEFE